MIFNKRIHPVLSILTSILVVAGFALAALHAFAITFENPLTVNTLMELVNKVIDFLFTLSIPFLIAIVLYGGFMMINSKGNPEEFKKGWKVILYAVIGLVVLLCAKGIGLVVQDLLDVSGGGGGQCTNGETTCSPCGTGMVQEGECVNGAWQHIGRCHTGACIM